MSGFAAFRRIVWSALLAGAITGILSALVQGLTTAPLIAQAEEYERVAAQLDEVQTGTAQSAHLHAPSRKAGAEHPKQAASPEGWEPGAGLERTASTMLTTTLAAFGYALLLGAVLSLLGASGLRAGLMLGVAGFAVFQLAPALGLPPEPPGVPHAALLPRQLWWLGTVAATSTAFACWYVARSSSKRRWLLAGIVLLVVPHMIGAPRTPVEATTVPHELIHRFAWMAMLVATCFWIVLGTSVGYIYHRLGPAPRPVS